MMGLDLSLSAVATALGSAVLHFLWQGAAIGVLAAVVLALIDRSRASARYATSCLALASCALIFLATFASALIPTGVAGTTIPPLPTDVTPALVQSTTSEASTLSLQLVQGIACLWIAGVVILQFRLAIQCLMIRRLTLRAVSAPTANWIATFEALKHDLRISPRVRMLRSTAADVPMVVGWISPVVLVPVSAFASLSPDQLKAVLVHELAHIRRHDHLLNAIQIVIETALFFHPVTWWLSNQIRTERENCCDDAAVRSSAHPRVFAEALARLETIRIASPQAALAATGGPLMSRIARIVGSNRTTPHRATAWRATLAIAAGTVVAAAGIAHALSAEEGPQDRKTIEILHQYADLADHEDSRVRALYELLIATETEAQRARDRQMVTLNEQLERAAVAGQLSRRQPVTQLSTTRRDPRLVTEVTEPIRTDRRHTASTGGQITRRHVTEAHELAELHRRLAAKTEEACGSIRAAVDAGEITAAEGQQKIAQFKQELELHVDHAQRLHAETQALAQKQHKEHLAALERDHAVQQDRLASLAARKASLEALASRNSQMSDEVDAVAESLRQYKQAIAAQDGATRPGQPTDNVAEVFEYVTEAARRNKVSSNQAAARIAELQQLIEVYAKQMAEAEDLLRQAERAVSVGDMQSAASLLSSRVAQKADQNFRQTQADLVAAERRAVDQRNRLADQLVAVGIQRKKLQLALDAVDIIRQHQSGQNQGHKIDPALREWLTAEGFTAEQIGLLSHFASHSGAQRRK